MKGDLEKALADFKKAAQLNPSEGGFALDIALAQFRLGQRQQALEYWRKAIALQPVFSKKEQ